MTRRRNLVVALASLALAFLIAALPVQSSAAEYKPIVGQQGKDVVWVPTPDDVVQRMLQMAQVTPQDFVVDLGSGDGRTVIAAAKHFGATSLGVEFNPDMVALSKKNAAEAGVADKVQFIEGDIYAVDFTKATVVTLYLLPELNIRLRPKLLQTKPGTRVVSHQFTMGDWLPDETSSLDGRSARFWVVPARVAGKWRITWPGQESAYEADFTQKYQIVEGAMVLGLKRLGLREVQLQADRIQFAFVDPHGARREFTGRVNGHTMQGAMSVGGKSVRWQARRS